MANNIITQTLPPRNTFPCKKEYLEGFFRTDYDITDYSMSCQLRNKMVDAILAGTNEQAFSILCAVDNIDHIPGAGENFVPLNGFANFYGVSEEFLGGVLTRRKFLHKNYPEDIKRVHASDLLHTKAVPLVADNHWRVSGRNDLVRYRIAGYYGYPCVSFPKNDKSFLIYSPRIVLATALHLIDVDKSGDIDTAKKVALAVKRSDYRIIPNKPENPEATPEDNFPITSKGDVKLSRELLDYIIHTVTKDAINGLAETITAYLDASLQANKQ